MAKKPVAEAATPATPAIQHTTIGGYRVRIDAFVPVNKKDLKQQAEVTTLLAAVQSGEKSVASIGDILTQAEIKIDYVNRRVAIENKTETTDQRQVADDYYSETDPDFDEIEEGESSTVRDADGELVDPEED